MLCQLLLPEIRDNYCLLLEWTDIDLVPLLQAEIVVLLCPCGLHCECHSPNKLLIGESTLLHLLPRQVLLELLIVLDELPDVLDGELIPTAFDVLQLDFTSLQALLLVLQDSLQEAQSAVLWLRQPYVH
jgi:hypothetical protein